MQDFLDKFHKPGETIVYLSSDMFTTGKGCSELPKSRHFLCCKVEAKLFAASTKGLAETYDRHVLIKNSSMSGDDGVVNMYKMVSGSNAERTVSKKGHKKVEGTR